jgi:quinoprotein glucose dehydrogenase
VASNDARLRAEGRRVLLLKAAPAEAVKQLSDVLTKGSTIERQGALALLATLKAPEADALLGREMDRLIKKQAPAEVQLDILQAAQQRGTAELKQQVAKYEAARPKTDPVAAFAETLAGGDPEAGRRVFFEKAEVSCLRCHKVNGTGGEVGPDLTGLAKRAKRDYILESIVDPNKQIAKGFDTIVLTLTSGQLKTGVLRSEDAKEVRLMTPEGQLLVVPTADIEERQRGPSAMPGDLVQKLSRSELRDLVEFLSSLQ